MKLYPSVSFGSMCRAGLFLCLSVLPLSSVSAQTPTAEELKIFQSLPQSQRDAILQQLRVGTGKSVGVPNTTSADQQVLVQRPGTALAEAQSAAQRLQDQNHELETRVKGGEQLLVELALPETSPSALPRSPDTERALNELKALVQRGNPYEVSSVGLLQLPGLRPIQLLGLSPKEVQQRLALDPSLREYSVAVTILRIDPTGAKALKPYGYEIFRDAANAQVPGTDIPVPDEYRVGPGDTVSVQLFGQQSGAYSLPVQRDGTISLPLMGPINVSGTSFGSLKGLVESRVKKQLIGTDVHVSIAELRSTRVLVLGDAERPGNYLVAGLSTATSALFASGGVKPIGSLRKIQIRRSGALIRHLDLYDVLLHGDTSNDVQLQTGDAVLVPPVGPTIGVDGAVRRPAIYELNHETTAAEVIALAGGLNPIADPTSATIERISERMERVIIRVDLSSSSGQRTPVQDGDLIRVSNIRPVTESGILVEGHVYRPGLYAFHPGIRLSEVISSTDELRPRADLNYVLVRREDAGTRAVSVFSADLMAALSRPGSTADIELSPRDRIQVFDLVSSRDHVIRPLLDELSRQSRPAEPMHVVEITGRVNAPGRYPLEPQMTIADLLRAGGGLQDAAYALRAELTRYQVSGGEQRKSELAVVDLAAVASGSVEANLSLRPYDVLTIQETPEWGRIENITLRGEVRFPGTYRIRRGESLRSVLNRAGGLTPLAFPEGAVFTREELRIREREQIDRLAERMKHDIAALSLESSQTNPAAAESLSVGRSLLDQLKDAKPVGRLVIDLKRVIADGSGSSGEIALRDGDQLVVPRLTQEVTVLGEVQAPTSHLFQPGMRREDVISMSGGLTARADRSRIYVVRANGSVVATPSRWFGSRSTEVAPGDTVVVPFDAEKMRPLPMWTAITTIVYNLAIAATAVGRL